MDDFDFDGETIVIGDEENVPLTTKKEISGNQQGIDPPGELSSSADLQNFGVFNGNFRLGPPNPANNLDVASSTTGSNFMPGWRFIQSSNTNITAKQVRDTASPSGSNLRFTFASGAAADAAYAEQIIDIGGNRFGGFPDQVRATVRDTASTGYTARLSVQYLTTDGTITGMPAEREVTAVLSSSAFQQLKVVATTDSIAPTTARYLRVRVGVSRSGVANGTTGDVNVYEVRREARVSRVEYTTAAASTWTKPAGAQFVRVILVGGGGGGGSGRRGAAGSARYGGGGGAGGQVVDATFTAGDLTDTVTVTIGAGGAGGATVATASTDGNPGGTGVASTFGGYLLADGGTRGSEGTATSGSGGSAGLLGVIRGGAGGDSSVSATAEAGAASSSGGVIYTDISGGPGGGGGGGGISAGNVTRAGGAGGVPIQAYTLVTAPAGGAAGGGDGVNGAAVDAYSGSGGGGGGACDTAGQTGPGGNGARGGGGGGAGGLTNGAGNGAGGDGGAGYCLVTAW